MRARCAVCRRPDRAKIDAALHAGSSLRSVASKHSIARTTLQRHKGHAPRSRSTSRSTATSTPASEGPPPPAIVDPVPEHELRAEPIAKSFAAIILRRIAVLERDGSTLAAPDFARVASSLTTSVLRLGRLTGETLEITDSKLTRLPAFRRVVDDVVQALLPFPAAMAAIADALERIERGESRGHAPNAPATNGASA